MKSKIIIIAALLLLLVLPVSGCRKSAEAPENDGEIKNEDELTIGVSFDSFLIERWQRDRDVFVDQCKSLGAKVNVQNANGDTQTQISQIEYLISKQVDAIVIVGIDSDALTVCTARKDGIAIDAAICYHGGVCTRSV